jgi:hypothetical protein
MVTYFETCGIFVPERSTPFFKRILRNISSIFGLIFEEVLFSSASLFVLTTSAYAFAKEEYTSCRMSEVSDRTELNPNKILEFFMAIIKFKTASSVVCSITASHFFFIRLLAIKTYITRRAAQQI